MAVKSSNIVKFTIKNHGEEQKKQNSLPLSSVTVSDDKLIELIVKQLPHTRRVLAGNQINIYFKKMKSMLLNRIKKAYINRIQLIKDFEKKNSSKIVFHPKITNNKNQNEKLHKE